MYVIDHYLGHNNYDVNINVMGTAVGYGTIASKSANSFTIYTADDASRNDLAFEFSIYLY